MESSSTESAEPKIGPVDSQTGYPSVTSEEVKKFAQMKKYVYDKLIAEERILSCEGVLFKARGFCITPRTAYMLKPHIVPIEEISGDELTLPKDFHQLNVHWQRRMAIAPSGIIGDPVTKLISWMQYFCVYGEYFGRYYDVYCTDPDCVVIFEEKEISTTTISNHENNLTNDDLRGSLHLIMLCMNKTLQDDTHVNTFVEKRLKAVEKSMCVSPVKLFYPNQFLTEVRSALEDLPKLKTILYWFCYNNRYNYYELDLTMKLQADTGMKTIAQAFNFVWATPRSLAHKNPIIKEETNHFMEHMRPKKDDAGPMWPYWKLLHPEDSSIHMNQYPNLRAAALFYRKARDPAFVNYEVHNCSYEIPNLEELCAKDDEEDPQARPSILDVQNPVIIAAAAYLGLDLNKVTIRE